MCLEATSRAADPQAGSALLLFFLGPRCEPSGANRAAAQKDLRAELWPQGGIALLDDSAFAVTQQVVVRSLAT